MIYNIHTTKKIIIGKKKAIDGPWYDRFSIRVNYAAVKRYWNVFHDEALLYEIEQKVERYDIWRVNRDILSISLRFT